ncbi:MAG: 50S ribosomal protein L9 [Coriobacteriia bacterium]|nr:50S ribosomal protein L9 [Coriobacteriia bacterium]
MKVILTQEVKGKGHEGDVVDVARGYAANYLLPRKMAVAATTGNLKQLEARMSNIEKRNNARRTDAEGIAQVLNGKTIVIEAKAGEEGKLFGSVTTLMIEEAIGSQLGPDVDHRKMDVGHPIKTTGDHPVIVVVFGEVKAEVVVRVVPEGAGAQAIATAAAPVEVADEAPVETEEPLEVVDAEAVEAVEADDADDAEAPEA